jgi:hypothetical protein
MFKGFWPKLLEADGDRQTDNDAPSPEECYSNRIASVDEDNQHETVEKIEVVDNNEE